MKRVLNESIERLANNVEENAGLRIFGNGIIFLLALTAAIVDYRGLLDIYPNAPVIILILLLVIVLSANFMLFARIRKRKIQISQLSEEISDNHKMIHRNRMLLGRVADTQSPRFRYQRKHEIFTVKENGDTNYTRRVWLQYESSPLYWYIFTIWLIEGEEFQNLDDLRISVKSLTSEPPHLLDWVPILFTGERLRIAVILDPIVTNKDTECSFEINLSWNGLWRPLMSAEDGFRDQGRLRIVNPTDKLLLEFVIPPNYFIDAFSIVPDIGSYEIKKRNSGHAHLKFVAQDVELGEYNYFIRCSQELVK